MRDEDGIKAAINQHRQRILDRSGNTSYHVSYTRLTGPQMSEENRQPDDAISDAESPDVNDVPDSSKASDTSNSAPNNAAAPIEATEEAGLPMPIADTSGNNPAGTASPSDEPLPPPPSFGRQMAQLVIIPAVIALTAIGLFAFFGNLASTEDKLEDQLIQLRQGSGYGNRLPAGVQDPRYKNRCLAAFNISQSIDQLEDPERRGWLNDQLIDILEKNVHRSDKELVTYLLIAIGRLGVERSSDVPSGLDIIVSYIDTENASSSTPSSTDTSDQTLIDQINQGVVMAILSWPDREAAATTLPDLIPLTTFPNPAVREVAVTAVGVMGKADETDVIDALLHALRSTDSMYRESRWNAAAALATFDQPEGIAFVLDTLLNRDALAEMPQDATKSTELMMKTTAQDRVMLSTLAWAQRMNDAKIWERIESLSENDASVTIRKAAIQMLEGKERR